VDDAAVEESPTTRRTRRGRGGSLTSEPPPIGDLYTDVYAGADEYLEQAPELGRGGPLAR
jgi:hypothetical protein